MVFLLLLLQFLLILLPLLPLTILLLHIVFGTGIKRFECVDDGDPNMKEYTIPLLLIHHNGTQ